MTRNDLDRALKLIRAELKEILISYFRPVTAAARGVRWLVERAFRHFHPAGVSISDKPSARR
jgi:hypothetical protein